MITAEEQALIDLIHRIENSNLQNRLRSALSDLMQTMRPLSSVSVSEVTDSEIEAAAKDYGTKVIGSQIQWTQDQIGNKKDSFKEGARWALSRTSQDAVVKMIDEVFTLWCGDSYVESSGTVAPDQLMGLFDSLASMNKFLTTNYFDMPLDTRGKEFSETVLRHSVNGLHGDQKYCYYERRKIMKDNP